MSDSKEFLEYIIKHLVDKPDEVQITEQEGEQTVIYQVRVGKGDIGKVLGKHGQHVDAIRTLISAVSAKGGKKRAILEIIE